MSNFHTLTINKIVNQTADAVSIEFKIPNSLQETFKYKAGQYITLKANIKGQEVRRAYSIWTAPKDNKLAVLVKKVKDGVFSTYANDVLKEDDVLEVMPPEGQFVNKSSGSKTYIAAGSGITPIFSLIKDELNSSANKLSLYYSNKTKASTSFYNELVELASSNDQLDVHFLFSQEDSGSQFLNGRITKDKCEILNNNGLFNMNDSGYYLCGPEEMIFSVKDFLEANNVNKENIHFELFTVSDNKDEHEAQTDITDAKVTMILDDDEFDFNYDPSTKESMLEAGVDQGLDLPFSCKGGVCCTCKAKVMEGKAIMVTNYALTDEEVEEGYILTCQSYPTTPNLTVSFDE